MEKPERLHYSSVGNYVIGADQYTGYEQFTIGDQDAGMSILDFWAWAYSDLMSNTDRGALAEYLVRCSLGITDTSFRIRSNPYDILSPSNRKIEVKCSAYLQSWDQDDFSKITFDIAKRGEFITNNIYDSRQLRRADIYVFCVYTALSRELSPLNIDLWDFYVLQAYKIDKAFGDQKKVSLGSLTATGKPLKVAYRDLGTTIETIDLQEAEA